MKEVGKHFSFMLQELAFACNRHFLDEYLWVFDAPVTGVRLEPPSFLMNAYG